MKKILDRTEYIFTPGVAGVGTIRFVDDAVPFESIHLITNVTAGVVVYQFNSLTRGAAGYDETTNTLTLDADTSAQNSADVLQVIVDAPQDLEFSPVTLAASDQQGYSVLLAANKAGQLIPADNQPIVGARPNLGTVVQFETTGYQSVSVQMLNGFGTLNWTVTFQVSNDGTTWAAVAGWPVAGAGAPITTANAVGQWVFPAAGRFFRVQVTTFTSGFPTAVCILKNQSAWMPLSSPSIAANQSVNLAQIAGTAPVNAGLAGVLAIGGNVAIGSAPTTNPISLAWDGANTRRILTDANSGGIVLGSSVQNNGQTIGRANQTTTTPAATTIKNGAGRLTMLAVAQNSTVAGFLHIFNAFLALGTSVDVFCFAIPANPGTYCIDLPDGGLYFSNNIILAFTAGAAANDNTAFGSAPNLTANYSFI